MSGASESPATGWSEALTALGLKPGVSVLVHTGPSIEPGALYGLMDAVQESIGSAGSIIALASDPAANYLRDRPDPVASSHPAFSFIAAGANAEFITRSQHFHFPLGSESPIARLHQLDGLILLAGTGQSANVSLHLAEIWADMAYTRRLRLVDCGGDEWKEMIGDPGCSQGFRRIEPVFRQARLLKEALVDGLPLQAMRIQQIVSMAREMLKGDPEALLCSRATCEDCTLARKLVAEQR